MDNFPDFSTESMGGATSFTHTPAANVQSYPDPINEVLIEDLTFKGNNDWYDGQAIMDTLQFSESGEDTPAGPLYKTSITGMVPKLTSAYLHLFARMARTKHIVCLKDNNGKFRMCGSIDSPLHFTFSQDSSKTPSGLSGFEFRFIGESKSPSPFLELPGS